MFRFAHLMCIVGAMAMLGVEAGAAESAAIRPEWQKVLLGPAGAAYAFPVYSSRRLNDDMSGVKRVLLIQHGRARNGDAYYLAAEKLMQVFDANPQGTLLISPQFFSPEQLAKDKLSDFPAWGSGGFAGGEDSSGWPDRVSSFQVYDDLLTMLTDRQRFPSLRKIVLAGHSGGAVLVQQFAVLNQVDEKVRAAGIEMRYVVANASAFLYFNEQRPAGSGFAAYDSALCPTYNDHRYGFNKIARYAGDSSPRELFRRYLKRDVVYLFGLEDTDPNHPSLDKSCAARAQGGNRLERGRGYLRHEQELARSARLTGGHRSFEVAGVGHDQDGMFSSTCGVRLIFDAGASGNGAPCMETTTTISAR